MLCLQFVLGEGLNLIKRYKILDIQQKNVSVKYDNTILHDLKAKYFPKPIFPESSLLAVADPSCCDGKGESLTWSFRACVRLKDGQTFSDLLDARKQHMDVALASASVITWACTNTNRIPSQGSNPAPFQDSILNISKAFCTQQPTFG